LLQQYGHSYSAEINLLYRKFEARIKWNSRGNTERKGVIMNIERVILHIQAIIMDIQVVMLNIQGVILNIQEVILDTEG
jgi:hypothetical protein